MASARPKYESQVAVQKFEKKISQVMEVEKEQGTSPFSPTSLPSVIFGKSHSIMIYQISCLHLLSKSCVADTSSLQSKRGNGSMNSSVL